MISYEENYMHNPFYYLHNGGAGTEYRYAETGNG